MAVQEYDDEIMIGFAEDLMRRAMKIQEAVQEKRRIRVALEQAGLATETVQEAEDALAAKAIEESAIVPRINETAQRINAEREAEETRRATAEAARVARAS